MILKNGDVLTFESNAAQRVAMSLAVAFPDDSILVLLPSERWQRFDKSRLSVTETDGKPVADFAERLKTMTRVLVATGGQPPSEKDLTLAKPGTLVLIVKD